MQPPPQKEQEAGLEALCAEASFRRRGCAGRRGGTAKKEEVALGHL